MEATQLTTDCPFLETITNLEHDISLCRISAKLHGIVFFLPKAKINFLFILRVESSDIDEFAETNSTGGLSDFGKVSSVVY